MKYFKLLSLLMITVLLNGCEKDSVGENQKPFQDSLTDNEHSSTDESNSCAAGFYGSDCVPCSDCGEHGYCNDGQNGDGSCICNNGWAGTYCDEKLWCPIGFTGKKCEECDTGYYGPECTQCNCGTHATCQDGVNGDGSCQCLKGWIGDHCDRCDSGYYGVLGPCINSAGRLKNAMMALKRMANVSVTWAGKAKDVPAKLIVMRGLSAKIVTNVHLVIMVNSA